MEFHRVLGRKHHKEFRQLVGSPFQAHLTFFHGLQQGALCAGRRTVDFVGQKHLRKHRTLANFKVALVRLVNRTAGHVGREQVRGKLDSGKIGTDRRRERLRQSRLARAGDVFNKHMAIGQQGHHEHFYGIVLAQKHRV